MSQESFAGRVGTQAHVGPGSRVAGYVLERQIGAGGMAVVYQARDIRLGRLVALKVMAPALAGDETFRLRFAREAQAAAAVDDPHIIPVYEAGAAGGILFIAMRFVGGGDLKSLLRRQGPLPPDRVISAISAVASALDAAHAIGLVHRDVKPANMLRDTSSGRADHVYLSDFGLSKAMQSSHLTGTSQFLGTPDYTAPEQISGAAADGRTDQYALACSAFELLTGSVPFHRNESWATVWAHMNTPPPPLTARRPELPPATDAVLAWAMAKNPDDRFPNCRAFADALRTALRTGRLPDGLPPAGFPTTGLAASGGMTSGITAADITGGTTAGTTTRGTARFGNVLAGADVRGATRSGPGDQSGRRGRMIALATAVVAAVAAAVAVAVPRLTHAHHGNAGHYQGLSGQSSPANVSMYGQAAVLTPPSTAGRWQEATSVAFSPDGKTLAVGLTTGDANNYRPLAYDGETYLFNVASGTQSAGLPLAGGTAAFSPDGKLLAATGGAGLRTVYLVTQAATGRASALSEIPGFGGQPVKALAFSPDGKLLAADDASGGFHLWSMPAGNPEDTEIGGQSATTGFAFSPDGHTIAVAGGSGGAISLWNTGTGSIETSIKVPGGELTGSLTYSPDGELLAAAQPGGKIGLWNVVTHHRFKTLQDASSQGTATIAISPDSQMLAVGDDNGKTYLWNLQTGQLIDVIQDPSGPVPPGLNPQTLHAVDSVAFSPDGKTLATSDTDGSAYLWRVR